MADSPVDTPFPTTALPSEKFVEELGKRGWTLKQTNDSQHLYSVQKQEDNREVEVGYVNKAQKGWTFEPRAAAPQAAQPDDLHGPAGPDGAGNFQAGTPVSDRTARVGTQPIDSSKPILGQPASGSASSQTKPSSSPPASPPGNPNANEHAAGAPQKPDADSSASANGQPNRMGTPAANLDEFKGAIQKGHGNRKETTINIQNLLKKAGYELKAGADGKFGPETQAALQHYTGQIDPNLAGDIGGINTKKDRPGARSDYMDTDHQLMKTFQEHNLISKPEAAAAGHHGHHPHQGHNASAAASQVHHVHRVAPH